jgi:hypothetical protein
MKRIITAALVAAFALALAGCASQQTTKTADQIRAQVAIACPVIQVALTSTQAMGTDLAGSLQTDLGTTSDLVSTICAANATLDTTNVQTLIQTAFPALMRDIQATNLAADKKQAAITAIALAQIALTAVVQLSSAPAAAASK